MSEADLTHGARRHGAMEAPPFAIPSKKLVMWLFIISDACTFGAMLFAYGYIKNAAADWPHPFESASIMNALLMTFILVTSSLTMLSPCERPRQGINRRPFSGHSSPSVLGLAFARSSLEGMVWTDWTRGSAVPESVGISHVRRIILRHYRPASGARSQRRDSLVVVVLGYKRGRYNSDDLEIWALYWHFVDLVWMFVVPMVYLMNVKVG